MERPPLGLMPRIIWEEHRKAEILSAVRRYEEANITPPAEWMIEYVELDQRHRKQRGDLDG